MYDNGKRWAFGLDDGIDGLAGVFLSREEAIDAWHKKVLHALEDYVDFIKEAPELDRRELSQFSSISEHLDYLPSTFELDGNSIRLIAVELSEIKQEDNQ